MFKANFKHPGLAKGLVGGDDLLDDVARLQVVGKQGPVGLDLFHQPVALLLL